MVNKKAQRHLSRWSYIDVPTSGWLSMLKQVRHFGMECEARDRLGDTVEVRNRMAPHAIRRKRPAEHDRSFGWR